MRAAIVHLAALVSFAVLLAGQVQTARTLDMYLIDVEGGNAQLYRLPGGESVLIDSGNGGAAAARDAARIVAAVKDAGLSRIDHLITTHYHGDHIGGLPELAAQVPVREFIDHGPNVQPGPQIDPVLARYAELYGKARHRVVKPDETLALKDVEWRFVSAGGQVIRRTLPGGGEPNPHCRTFSKHEINPVSGAPVGSTEDELSVGSHITFGRFRLLYLGDFTWNQEFDLTCPSNRVGRVDLFVASRHGQPSSNSEALVHAVQPRVILMNNGIHKGGQPQAMKILLGSPGLQNLWALHFSQLGGQDYTVPGLFVANEFDEPQTSMPLAPMIVPAGGGAAASPPPAHNGTAYWIQVSARRDGSFTVTNSRNGFRRTYEPRS
jgi:competence protein ComEC